MNKVLIRSGIVLVVVAAFVGGYHIGNQRGRIISLGLAARVNALQNEHLLTQLETGKIEDTKSSLNLMLDGNVLEIDAFRTGSNKKEAEKTVKILAKIAEHRQKYPYSSPAGGEVNKTVNEILKRALSKEAR